MIINDQYREQNTSINDEYKSLVKYLYKGKSIADAQYNEMKVAFFAGSCFILNLIYGYFQKLNQDSVQIILREQIREIMDAFPFMTGSK